MEWRDTLPLLCFSMLWFLFADAASGTKCYKNKEIGEYADNIYYCEDDAKPECCEDESQFTCCETTSKHIAKDQIILWGCVFGVVGCVTFVWICYRKDTYMCEGAPIVQRCRDCTNKKDKADDEELTEINNKNITRDRKFSNDNDKFSNSSPNQQETSFTAAPLTARHVNPIVVQEVSTTRAGTSTTRAGTSTTRAGTSTTRAGTSSDYNRDGYSYDEEDGDTNYHGNEELNGQGGYPGYPGYDYDNPNPSGNYDPDDLYNPVVDDEFSVGEPANSLPPIAPNLQEDGPENKPDGKTEKKPKKDKKKKKKKSKEPGDGNEENLISTSEA